MSLIPTFQSESDRAAIARSHHFAALLMDDDENIVETVVLVVRAGRIVTARIKREGPDAKLLLRPHVVRGLLVGVALGLVAVLAATWIGAR